MPICIYIVEMKSKSQEDYFCMIANLTDMARPEGKKELCESGVRQELFYLFSISFFSLPCFLLRG